MTVFTTFFVATPADLQLGFPGRGVPAPADTRPSVSSPGPLVTGVRVLKRPGVEPLAGPASGDDGLSAEALSSRLPAFIRARPHWATTGITALELTPILAEVSCPGQLENVLHPNPGAWGTSVQQLPIAASTRLRLYDPAVIARSCAERMSNGWTAAGARAILTPLVELARQTGAQQRIYLLTEM